MNCNASFQSKSQGNLLFLCKFNVRQPRLPNSAARQLPESALIEQFVTNVYSSFFFLPLSHIYAQVLKLSGNRLESLPNGTFAHLAKLLKLELNDCGLRRIEIDSFSGLDQLQYLQLANNKLFAVNELAFAKLRRRAVLRLLYLYGNPWHCDCHLRWLHEWVEEGLITYDLDASRDKVTSCRSPSSLSRQRWTALHSVQFACHPRLLSPQERTLVVNQYESLNFSCSIFLDPPSSPIW